ncbi:hypothetical protein KI387_037042, partial [Taxus chinensis]
MKTLVPEVDQDEIDGDLLAVLFIDLVEEWYSNIAYFLMYGEFPYQLSRKEKRTIKLKSKDFVLWDN